uniref:probable E3 SUMO-protein ligase RNF212 isoform X2 n=1 Tax=Nyctereutes procyonoides TaxID=34880 RepID=UPI0024444FE9|nr:probable E3 SUMO-protein ligase RNF212 isoform X2 [Nyctereutes procyonoides]
MAGWVFCNRCFQPPHRASRFSLTNCGHVYCDVCLRKGGKDECLICKVPCRTLLLSKHTDVDIQALFMGIDGLCKKYSRETSQVSEFQEKHRRRLLAFYREKIARLEESLQKSVLRMEQLQRWVLSTSSRGAPDRAACLAICLRPCDQGSRRKSTFICQKLPSKQKCSRSMRLSQEPVLGAMKTPVSTPSAKPAGHLLLRLESSASDRVESMQVDRTPSPTRKPEVAAGPARISLISPPQHGRMGSVSHGGPQLPGLTPSLSSVSQALRNRPRSANMSVEGRVVMFSVLPGVDTALEGK